jgi:alpha-glucosidase
MASSWSGAGEVSRDWWRTAVVYQVYIRSFCDASGDGIGDVEGLRSRLDYLRDLGVDGLWINPWYLSPQADAGYDVADYRQLDPAYGSLEDADLLIREAHEHGLRVLLDVVPNHTSSEHPWFVAALSGDADARARYLFRPGRGVDGSQPPNDWQSSFGGPAWTRVATGEWYLHLFAPGQPDLDWTNPDVRAEFEEVLRFWFDRGADGFRVDVAHGLAKAPGLPDAGKQGLVSHAEPHPAWDQDEVHEIYRSWRKVAESYAPPRVFVGEVWVASNERLAHYLRDDELQSAFFFDLLRAPFDAGWYHRVVDDGLAQLATTGSVTWVLANHDVVRQRTRYARSQPDHLVEAPWERRRWASEAPDLDLGLRRARAAALLMLALPGSAYLYQGEELGLPEVEDIPAGRRQDPIWEQSGGEDPGRDGCRVPLPWDGTEPPYAFGDAASVTETWLPQPGDWASMSRAAQHADPNSTLSLYRHALLVRRELLVETDAFAWIDDTPPGVLAFRRGRLSCWLNTGDVPVPLPAGQRLLGSEPGVGKLLPTNAAVWMDTE